MIEGKSLPRFIIDVSMGVLVEDYLQEAGTDFLSVRKVDPKMKDMDILAMAVKEKRIIITLDKDFGELVYNSGMPHAGVLLLRLEDAKAPEKVRILANILEKYAHELPGHFCVFSNDRFRIKK